MQNRMSDTVEIAARNPKGQFIAGHSGNGGRPRGARSKLGEQFVEDLRSVWETHGKQALIDCAENEPAQFVRVLAGLLPKTIDINATLDVTEFAGRFRSALQLLGNEAEPSKPRRPLKVINAR
jgi:hypothetical protein